MSDVNGVETPTAESQTPDAEPQQPVETFDREYVSQLREEAKQNRLQLEAFKAEQAKAEDERLAKQQEWQALAEKRQAELEAMTPYKEKYEAMLSATAEANKKRVESIPDDMRSIIPDYDDPLKLSQWLDTNWALLNAKPLVPNLNGGAGNGSPRTKAVVLTDAQIRAAEKMGVSLEDYQKAIAPK